ncbi:MAG: hypothetical protein IT462_14945 [Planctomycetes bacterium]|nr:hypothetical protein [Planctomycetota bacterium]
MLKVIAPLFVLTLLAGCGAPRYFKTEVLDEAALKQMRAYHAHPVDVDFTRPATWELKDGEWNEMMEHGDQAYTRGLLVVDKPAMFKIGKDSMPASSDAGPHAVIDLKITNIKRGHYSFFTWGPAILDCWATITDAKTGKVIFKGFAHGITPERGGTHYNWELAGDDGRLKGAHYDIGRKLAWTLEYYANQK